MRWSLSSVMVALRRCLRTNKILFETVAALLVSVMALLVSYHATRLATLQTQLTKLEKQPLLRFDIDLDYDPARQFYYRDTLVVTNDGAPAKDFNASDYVFLRIELRRPSNKNQDVKLVVVNGYYGVSFKSKNATGRLATFANFSIREGNHYKAVALERRVRDLMREQGILGQVSLVVYIRAVYHDIWGDLHDETYRVDQLATSRLDSTEAKQIRDEHEAQFRKGPVAEFDRLSAEGVMAMVRESLAQPTASPGAPEGRQ